MNTPEAINYNSLDRKSLLPEILSKDHTIQKLEAQLAWFKKQIFGKKSERIVSDLNADQLLFEGFESPSKKEGKKTSVSAHERTKPVRDGKDKITSPMIYRLKPPF